MINYVFLVWGITRIYVLVISKQDHIGSITFDIVPSAKVWNLLYYDANFYTIEYGLIHWSVSNTWTTDQSNHNDLRLTRYQVYSFYFVF